MQLAPNEQPENVIYGENLKKKIIQLRSIHHPHLGQKDELPYNK